MIKKYSACLATTTEFIDPSNVQPVSMQDWTNLNYDELTWEEFLPQHKVQPNDPLPQVGLGAADFSEEIIWDEMCNELFSDYSIEQFMINSSTNNTGSALVGDQSILSYHDKDIETIPYVDNCLAPDDTIMPNNDYGYDPCEEIQSSSLLGFDESAWIAKQSEEDNELTNNTSMPKPVEEPAAIMEDNWAYHLPDEMYIESFKYQNSSIVQCKDGDLMGLEVSIPGIHRIMPSPISNTEGFTSHLMGVQNNSINKDQEDTIEQEFQKGSRKQEKKRGCGKRSRPRDRQLIQDRITELRELIPNGSKCSIEELLERTIALMMFLESVPAHAEKLNKANRTKVDTDSRNHGKPFLACEFETEGNNLPVIVENLEQEDQMLIEMQCRDYGVFLDTAQAFKNLKLTILKGMLQSRSTEQWARFIVQVPIGFNRMDIFWPLMRLLQFKF